MVRGLVSICHCREPRQSRTSRRAFRQVASARGRHSGHWEPITGLLLPISFNGRNRGLHGDRLARFRPEGGPSNPGIDRRRGLTMQPVPLRKTGLDVLGERPWGTHFCVFYETNDDLVEMLIPYFKTGLENREFCFWVLAEHLTEDDARSALSRAIPRSDRHLIEKNIKFLGSEECYLKGGAFNLDRVTAE